MDLVLNNIKLKQAIRKSPTLQLKTEFGILLMPNVQTISLSIFIALGLLVCEKIGIEDSQYHGGSQAGI